MKISIYYSCLKLIVAASGYWLLLIYTENSDLAASFGYAFPPVNTPIFIMGIIAGILCVRCHNENYPTQLGIYPSIQSEVLFTEAVLRMIKRMMDMMIILLFLLLFHNQNKLLNKYR
jgi:hypothetical protein